LRFEPAGSTMEVVWGWQIAVCSSDWLLNRFSRGGAAASTRPDHSCLYRRRAPEMHGGCGVWADCGRRGWATATGDRRTRVVAGSRLGSSRSGTAVGARSGSRRRWGLAAAAGGAGEPERPHRGDSGGGAEGARAGHRGSAIGDRPSFHLSLALLVSVRVEPMGFSPFFTLGFKSTPHRSRPPNWLTRTRPIHFVLTFVSAQSN
jgi:hypothetical protein